MGLSQFRHVAVEHEGILFVFKYESLIRALIFIKFLKGGCHSVLTSSQLLVAFKALPQGQNCASTALLMNCIRV